MLAFKNTFLMPHKHCERGRGDTKEGSLESIGWSDKAEKRVWVHQHTARWVSLCLPWQLPPKIVSWAFCDALNTLELI